MFIFLRLRSRATFLNKDLLFRSRPLIFISGSFLRWLSQFLIWRWFLRWKSDSLSILVTLLNNSDCDFSWLKRSIFIFSHFKISVTLFIIFAHHHRSRSNKHFWRDHFLLKNQYYIFRFSPTKKSQEKLKSPSKSLAPTPR